MAGEPRAPGGGSGRQRIRHPFGGVVNREDVNFVVAHEAVDDAIRAFDDFPHQLAFEFWNDAAGVGEIPQAIDGPDQSSDDHGRVVRGVLLDECAMAAKSAMAWSVQRIVVTPVSAS